MAAMTTSPAGIALIREHEGVRLSAYICPAGVLTIGCGHTGPDVMPGMTIDEAEVGRLLRKDLASAEACVNRTVKVPMTQGQFDALVSFTFNLGCGALGQSTLLKKFSAGDIEGAAKEFGRWVNAGGKPQPGLIRRRADEARMFLGSGAR